jgi:hypothetical protein
MLDISSKRKLTINRILNGYQVFLLKGTNPIDKCLSFHKYLTSRMKYYTTDLF